MHHGLLSLRMNEKLARDPTLCNDALLKGAALLYKNVVFFSGSERVKAITEEVSAGLSKTVQKDASTIFLPTSALDPEFEQFTDWDVLTTIDKLAGEESISLSAWRYLGNAYILRSLRPLIACAGQV